MNLSTFPFVLAPAMPGRHSRGVISKCLAKSLNRGLKVDSEERIALSAGFGYYHYTSGATPQASTPSQYGSRLLANEARISR